MRKLSYAHHHHHHHPSLPLMYHELRRYKRCLEQSIIALLLELLHVATEALTVLQALPIIDLFGCSGRPHTHHIIDNGASLTY